MFNVQLLIEVGISPTESTTVQQHQFETSSNVLLPPPFGFSEICDAWVPQAVVDMKLKVVVTVVL